MKDDERKNEEIILSYLKKHGIINKDLHLTKNSDKKHRNTTIQQKKRKRIQIDLHGLRSEDALVTLRQTFERAYRSGVKEILIIHGYGLHSSTSGSPVLKNLVKNELEKQYSHRIQSTRSALPKEGGQGATVVFLK